MHFCHFLFYKELGSLILLSSAKPSLRSDWDGNERNFEIFHKCRVIQGLRQACNQTETFYLLHIRLAVRRDDLCQTFSPQGRKQNMSVFCINTTPFILHPKELLNIKVLNYQCIIIAEVRERPEIRTLLTEFCTFSLQKELFLSGANNAMVEQKLLGQMITQLTKYKLEAALLKSVVSSIEVRSLLHQDKVKLVLG